MDRRNSCINEQKCAYVNTGNCVTVYFRLMDMGKRKKPQRDLILCDFFDEIIVFSCHRREGGLEITGRDRV